MDAISKRWKTGKVSKFKNAQYIIGIEAMKVGIRLTSEEVIKQIWHDILVGFNELIRLNEANRLKKEFPKIEDMLDLVKDKIETGELFSNDRNF